ncbi:DUF58 domain-containing protein [Quadrisphaera setariae]|uniref:DUF58 domain-containing protein n=1 Tax=Quadrisphaera setariae TaxID=2593304 RepID=A0A5C8ZE06_9ACTN|nr:DUF58 domain-containing protein [Quadrisphaera setariae]TXR55734.1 DUF58 domain-containing protein [Quadrisphaera setariae]
MAGPAVDGPVRAGRTGRAARWVRSLGLTRRGRALLVVGVALGAAGVWQGQQALLRVALLVLLLPLVSLGLAALASTGLGVRRSTTPSRAVVGQPCRVRLDLRNPGRVATPVLLAQDHLPAGWPRAPRFTVDPLPPGGRAAVAYSAVPPRRGHHRLGPLRVRVTDPLGLCELPARSGGRDDVLALPATVEVPGAASLLSGRGGDDAGGGVGAASGERGMSTREYRPGDDVRRVHWRSTARRGELMVRQDEQPRQRRGAVVLDRRPGAFADADAFERAVSAAASLATSLHDAGAAVHLELGPPATAAGAAGSRAAGREGLLEQLALVDLGDEASLAAALAAALGRRGESDAREGVLAVVAGRLSRADAELLAGAQGAGVAGVRRRAAALAVLGQAPAPGAVEALLRAGWAVLDLSEGEPLADAWQRAREPVAAGVAAAGAAGGGAP